MELSIRGPKENLFNILGKKAANTTSTITNSAIKAANVVSDFAATTGSTLTEATTSAVNSVASAAASVARNVPIMNSLFPVGSNTGTRSNASLMKSLGLGATNNSATTTLGAATRSTAGVALIVFLVIAGIVTTVMIVFKKEVAAAYETVASSLRSAFGGEKPEVLPPSPTPSPEATASTASTGGLFGAAQSTFGEAASLVGSVLPTGSGKEVFNISSNDFTFYDAEPLCRALGAELATYDQVQKAWEKGADWCNYGWTKGQLAVYPTQEETYKKLQAGPEDQREACGNPGLNGGYFDNPELRFGVNCYGPKPSQSANDERVLQERGAIPKTTDTLKVDQQAQQYKEMIGSVGVLPFNEKAWSEA